jgi:hypothetical protein
MCSFFACHTCHRYTQNAYFIIITDGKTALSETQPTLAGSARLVLNYALRFSLFSISQSSVFISPAFSIRLVEALCYKPEGRGFYFR